MAFASFSFPKLCNKLEYLPSNLLNQNEAATQIWLVFSVRFSWLDRKSLGLILAFVTIKEVLSQETTHTVIKQIFKYLIRNLYILSPMRQFFSVLNTLLVIAWLPLITGFFCT